MGAQSTWGNLEDGTSVKTEVVHFEAFAAGLVVGDAPSTREGEERKVAASAVIFAVTHVPRTVQTACDPGLACIGKRLGIDIGTDPDPIWDWGHTGVHLYPSAVRLGNYLLSDAGRVWLLGKRVLELGCGIGLLGPVAALAGASDVLLTDFDPVVLDLCSHNQSMNKGIAGLGTRCTDVRVHKLDWRSIATGLGNSSSGDPGLNAISGVDVVLASDVIFDEELSSALAVMLREIFERNPCAVGVLGVQYREDNPLKASSSTVQAWLDVATHKLPSARTESQSIGDSMVGAQLSERSERSRSRSPRECHGPQQVANHTNKEAAPQSASHRLQARLLVGATEEVSSSLQERCDGDSASMLGAPPPLEIWLVWKAGAPEPKFDVRRD